MCTKITLLVTLLFCARVGFAAKILTLNQYLEQVQSDNPAARAARSTVKSAENHQNFSDTLFMPEAYAQYSLSDSKQPPTSALAPAEQRGRNFKLGVRDQNRFGTSVDASYQTARSLFVGFSPPFPMYTDYELTTLGVQVTQPLWRNGFGETNRAMIKRQQAMDQGALLQARFQLKNILLKAENTYWSLVSYNEILKLQAENVDRARRLRDHMAKSAEMRLFDDVDAMQTEASYQSRELERLQSDNDRASLLRDFNTLRGATDQEVEPLEDLPKNEFLLRRSNDPARHMTREDFRQRMAAATELEANAEGAITQLNPQLDIVAGLNSFGLDNQAGIANNQASHLRNPTWNVGLVFSVPLDFGLIGETRRSYRAQAQAAKDLTAQAKFEEQRTWDALLKNQTEAQVVFERSIALETLTSNLVKRERQRLLNGRSTTLQTVTIEQNLALAQIARVRAQLALLNIHNLIKQFGDI